MSRSISSISTSELSNLNFVDLNEQEMTTLAGGSGGNNGNNGNNNGGLVSGVVKEVDDLVNKDVNDLLHNTIYTVSGVVGKLV